MLNIVRYTELFQDEDFLARLSEYLDTLLAEAGKSGCELNLVFCDDGFIRNLNKEYRGKDQPTDVLSFSQSENADEEETDASGFEEIDDGEAEELGDVIVSVERAALQASEAGVSLSEEIARLSIHGTLHILGYDHETSEADEKVMFDKQDRCLEDFMKKISH